MKEMNERLQIDYWDTINLETLHYHSREWLSEIDFWKDELRFMQNLLQKHFLFFFEKEGVTAVNELTTRLSSTLTEGLNQLEQDVQLHEKRLVALIKSSKKQREDAYRMEHGQLEDRLNQYAKHFKKVKRELFKMAEAVLKEEKMKFLAKSTKT